MQSVPNSGMWSNDSNLPDEGWNFQSHFISDELGLHAVGSINDNNKDHLIRSQPLAACKLSGPFF